MRPSMDEVLQKLLEMHVHKKHGISWIFIEQLADQLETHSDNIIPHLLMLEKEEYLHFRSKNREAVALRRQVVAA